MTAQLNSEGRFKKAMYKSGCTVYCCYCMEPVPKKDATVEHCVPKWYGGKDHRENLLIACGPCNSIKGGKDDNIHWKGHNGYECYIKCGGGECRRHEFSKKKMAIYAREKFGVVINLSLHIKEIGAILKQCSEAAKAAQLG